MPFRVSVTTRRGREMVKGVFKGRAEAMKVAKFINTAISSRRNARVVRVGRRK